MIVENKGSNSFLKNFFTLGVGSFLYLIVGLIGTPIITRLVDPVDYGQMSILSVYSNMGMMFCGLGLDQTLVRYFYREERVGYQRGLLYSCCLLPLLMTVVAGVALLVSYGLGLKWITLTELVLLVINVITLLLSRYAMLILRLRYKSKTYSTVHIVQKASYILLTVLLVWVVKGHHFVILAVATIISTVLATVIAIASEREVWRFPAQGDRSPVRQAELLRYGFPLMLSSSISVVFNALDKLFIEHFCTMTDVGVYASAMNLMAIFSIVRTSFNAIWMPSAVEHYERNPGDKTFYQKGNAFISIVMLSFGAAVILFKDLFVLLLGSKYQAASMILPYLMLEPIMYTISETTATGIVVQKKSAYQVIVAGGACLVNFLGNWLLTPVMGPQGAALSTGVSYIVFFALRTGLANRVFYVKYGLPRFAMAVAALFAFAIYGSNNSFSWHQILMFLGVMAVIVLAYRKDIVFAVQHGRMIIRKKLRGE